MEDEHEAYWKEMKIGRFQFNRTKALLQQLDQVTNENVWNILQGLKTGNSVLSIQIFQENSPNVPAGISLDYFREKSMYYNSYQNFEDTTSR